jgi:hypothetical protein
MTATIKLTGALYASIIGDLVRPHPFAAERVGFASGRMGSLPGGGRLVLLSRYYPIPDGQYVDDPSVGARIGSEALTSAMRAVYHNRPSREGIFHVHLHGHKGVTGMSGVDSCEIPALMPGFRSVGPQAAHGIIILSLDHGSGWTWLPGEAGHILAGAIAVIGAPLEVFEQEAPA